jgi:hypothetical protein
MPRIRIPRSLAGALVLMLAVSCQNPVCGCLSPPDVAVVYGTVTDAAGNPVEKAAVRAEEGPRDVRRQAFSVDLMKPMPPAATARRCMRSGRIRNARARSPFRPPAARCADRTRSPSR